MHQHAKLHDSRAYNIGNMAMSQCGSSDGTDRQAETDGQTYGQGDSYISPTSAGGVIIRLTFSSTWPWIVLLILSFYSGLVFHLLCQYTHS